MELEGENILLNSGGGETKGLIKHIFNFDEKSKNILLNSLQYLIILFVPLKLINDLLDYLFENQEYSNRNTLVILLESLVEIMITVILIFIIHRFITYIPTYSNTPYENINLVHIAIMVAFYKVHTNERFKTKINFLIGKFNEEISPKDKKIEKIYNPLKKVMPSNLNNTPTHIPSQADNLNRINPNLRSLEHQAIEQSNNLSNNNDLSLGLLPQNNPNYTQNHINNLEGLSFEPEAANNGNGGFSSW